MKYRPKGRDKAVEPLTKREMEIARMIAQEHETSNKEIAKTLGIAVYTLKSHIHNIFQKLSLHSRLELAVYVHQGKLKRK